jgi:hypothetical protein
MSTRPKSSVIEASLQREDRLLDPRLCDAEEIDAAMVRDGRVVLSITVDRIYPLDRT